MDEGKRAKKGVETKSKKIAQQQQEEDAPAGEVVFGAASNTDMVNFGGEGDEHQFGEKEREPNIIRKSTNIFLSISLHL